MRTATLAVLSVVLVACHSGADDLEDTLAVAPGELLEVDLYMGEGLRPDQGSLEIMSHDAEQVRVVATASGWGASGVSYRLERGEGTVRLLGRVTGSVSWLFGGPQLTVRIWVPRQFSLDLRASAGPIRVDDVAGRIRARGAEAIEVNAGSGPIRLRTSDGDVRVSETEGEVDVRTSEGDIELSWISGQVEARTGAGEIRADHASGTLVLTSGGGSIEIRELDGRAEARTERGSIFASFVGAPAGEFETSRGSVRVVVPEDAGADLEMTSRRGSVELAPGLPLDGSRNEAHVLGKLGGGGALLRLFTARGGAQLSRR